MKRLAITLLAAFAATAQGAKTADSDAYLQGLWSGEQKLKQATSQWQDRPWGQCFKETADKYQLSPDWLLALARGESDFDPKAVSKANAIGLMQIQWPGTAKHLGVQQRAKLFEPCTNIEAGGRYFRELLDRFNNNPHHAFAAYNYGPTRIARLTEAGRGLPDGARWYSAYIYDHLQKIRTGKLATGQRIELIAFTKAFRARAFKEYLQGQIPKAAFDWFATPLGKFKITVTPNGAVNRQQLRRQLIKLGIRMK